MIGAVNAIRHNLSVSRVARETVASSYTGVLEYASEMSLNSRLKVGGMRPLNNEGRALQMIVIDRRTNYWVLQINENTKNKRKMHMKALNRMILMPKQFKRF